MKTKSIIKSLNHFRSFDLNGCTIYQSRACLTRIIKVINQGESSIAIPLFINDDNTETVAFHAKSIKSLVKFLQNKQE